MALPPVSTLSYAALPTAIMEEIGSFLNTKEIRTTINSVCRHWRSIKHRQSELDLSCEFFNNTPANLRLETIIQKYFKDGIVIRSIDLSYRTIQTQDVALICKIDTL